MNANNFMSIGTTALLILNRLRNARALRELAEQGDEKKIEDDQKLADEKRREEEAKSNRDYVNHRLRELRAWEKRIGDRIRKA